MNSPRTAPYGTWISPITAERVAAAARRLDLPIVDGDDLYWFEGRPAEAGRVVLVRRDREGRLTDLTPPPFSVRTRVHEYGGGACCVEAGTVCFVNFSDQDIYRLEPGGDPVPIPITRTEGRRYADLVVDRQRRRILCVREDHGTHGEPFNTLTAVDPAGGGEQVLVSGSDFYASPRLSPDGSRLAWLSWDHPRMPWDGTELWVADLAPEGSVTGARLVAGGPEESIFQPEWSPEGRLYYVSDRTGWWNLYRWEGSDVDGAGGAAGGQRAVTAQEAEFGAPQWRFATFTYGFVSEREIWCLFSRDGIDHLARLDPDTGRLEPLDQPFTAMGGLRAAPGRVVFLGASAVEPQSVVVLDPGTGRWEAVARAQDEPADPAWLSVPEPLTYPTAGGAEAHALFYPPANRDFTAPTGERPPVVVMSHGGPTGATQAALNLNIQFWTSRGFAVVDVNYGGSTGYGRAYRERLKGRWGLVDVEDCIHAVRYLAAAGRVDAGRAVIRGGSAGGYTTLAALTFHNTFRAGASYFGVSDLEALARETHKFESRYLDGLVGPYPEAVDVYRERSPIHHVDRLSCPVIFFQGLRDRVVPPNQAEMMVEALKEKGIPVAYVTFAEEDHGFRDAGNIRRALAAEYTFYCRVLGLPLSEDAAPLHIHNLDGDWAER